MNKSGLKLGLWYSLLRLVCGMGKVGWGMAPAGILGSGEARGGGRSDGCGRLGDALRRFMHLSHSQTPRQLVNEVAVFAQQFIRLSLYSRGSHIGLPRTLWSLAYITRSSWSSDGPPVSLPVSMWSEQCQWWKASTNGQSDKVE